MQLREWKDRFLAIPWVYDVVRPIVAGGIDYRILADFCAIDEADRVFDFGCGTGQVLPFLRCAHYLGVDLDASALTKASRHSTPQIRFMEGDDWDQAYQRLCPTVILMIGVVHHLPDPEFMSMVKRFRRGDRPPARLVTIDVSFFPGQRLNNLFSRLDRGRHVRTPAEYEGLFRGSGLIVLKSEILPTRSGYVRYIGYHLHL
ncbi:MAG TPA: class I SAM-dependent methyltransferase [Acidobacteriota bacterium]|nr:class I SAM-dependent methyltransferase [Acidobacteriota bacterium]